ncbi:MAG: lipopolysaccharide biosynthesis protein [Rickettsiales bacterium]
MSVKKILFGTALLSAVRVFRLLSQFVAIPILSRLLSPAEYGLVALAMPFAVFAMLLADAGIGMSLVRTPASERRQWSTCFWLAIVMGAVLCAIVAGIAPIAAHVFNEPELTPIIITLSIVVLLQAIHLIPVAALQQAERFKSIALVDVLSTVIGLTIAVYMAHHGYGAWALIGQQLALFVVRVVMMCWLSPFRPLLVFDWPLVREHMLFGRNVLGTSLINYFSRTFDNWVIGRSLGAGILGFYSMAFQFARLPGTIVTGPLQYVIYSQLAKLKDDSLGISNIFFVATRFIAILVLPTMGMVAVAHTPIFTILLSDKWNHAGYIFMILAPASALQAVVCIGETVIYAKGRTDIQMRASAEYTVLWVIALIGAVSFGLPAAALAYSACTILYQFRYLSVVLPLIGLRMRYYFSAYINPLLCTAAGMLAYTFIESTAARSYLTETLIAAFIALCAIITSLLTQQRLLRAEISKLNIGKASMPLQLDTGIEDN